MLISPFIFHTTPRKCKDVKEDKWKTLMMRKTVWRYKGSLWEASMTQSGKKEIEDGSLMIVGMITVQDALNILRGVLKNPMHIN